MINTCPSYPVAMLAVVSAEGLSSETPVGDPRFMQGPVVGVVTADKITIWGRVNGVVSWKDI